MVTGPGQWRRQTRRASRDRVERLYRQNDGIFTPPSWPVALPVSQRVLEEDRAWRELQAQWGMQGLALSKSLIRLEAAINAAVALAEDNPPAVVDSLRRLRRDINDRVATPLAHALRMAGWQFNELSIKRRKHIAKSIWEPQLSRWLEDAEDSLTELFPDNISSRDRRTDGLFCHWRAAPSTPPHPTRVRPAPFRLPTKAGALSPIPPTGPFAGALPAGFWPGAPERLILSCSTSLSPPASAAMATAPSAPQAIEERLSKQLTPR